MRKFLLLIALIISGLGLNAQSVGDETIINYDGYSLKFTVTKVSPAECSVICSKHPTSSMAVTIPASVEIEGTNFNVTSIGNSAFESCSSLTSIEIPSGVTSIGGAAFYQCSSLTSIEIPSGVTSIGATAFYECSSLTSIEIPSGVTSIGNFAFNACSSLESITVEDGNTAYDSRDNCNAIIESSTNKLIAGCKNTIIPDDVTSIGNSAFESCSSLTSIEIPSGVTSIGDDAFYDCDALTSIEIPSSVTSIGERAFYQCSSLYGIRCHAEAVPNTGNYVFDGCPIKNIQVPAASVELYEDEMPWNSFNITEIYPYIPGDVAIIDYTNYSLKFTVTNVLPAECSVICSKHPTSSMAVTIPASVEIEGTNFNVTSIGNSAFYFCPSLTSIEIPSGVTSIGSSAFFYCYDLESVTFGENSQLASIGNSAFYLCSNLTSIEIPSGVTSIGDNAFYDCYALTSIEIPSGVTSIGDQAFSSCSSLESITVEDGNTAYDSRDNCNAIIESSTNKLIAGCKNTIIPDDVTSIGGNAFYQCSSLTSIEIPSGVTSIGDYAFSGCSSLYGIRCHAEAVPNTGNYVFDGCPIKNIQVPAASVELYEDEMPWNSFNITEIYPYIPGDVAIIDYTNYSLKFTVTNVLPAECEVTCSTKPTVPTAVEIPSTVEFNGTDVNVTSIGTSAFNSCSSLENVTFGENSQLTSIGGAAFYQCSSLTGVSFGENSQLTSIGSSAFSYCDALTSIEIPSSVTSIGNYAFYQCSSLTSIEIPSGVTSIGDYAFNYCYALTNIEIPSGVTSIGYSAFSYCDALTSIEIPSGVTSIGDYAFFYCSSLTNIEIPSGVTSIGDYAFSGCSSLTSIEIPSGVTSIGERVFCDCDALTSIEIPSGVTSIGGLAFYSCDALTSIEIPSSVTSIGEGAFYGCDALTSIKCHAEEVPTTGSDVFNSCPSDMTIQVPAGSVALYQAASPWNEYIIVAGFNSTITVSSNIAEAGSVTGGGTYTDGSSATVSAIANTGYCFQNWTEDGEIVSYSNEYTFNVSNDRNLVANFVEYHWKPNTSYSNNMSMIAIVKIEDVEQRRTDLEIGAFCGDELRGRGILKYENSIDRYYLYLIINGNTSDEISFRIYDHSASSELDLMHIEKIVLEVNTTIGSITSPYEFNFITGHVRTLSSGWNWYSTYISLSGASGLNTIQTALGTAARQIKNQDAFDTYELGQWFGSLDKASTDKMYMIDMAEDEYELVITGAVVNSQECPITINKNWNWISYPVNSSMSISDALAGFTPQHGDYLKSQTAFSQYSEGNGWLGALQVLEPGEGYMYQNTSGEEKTLIYANPTSKAELAANITTENNYWSVNATKYPTNMNVIAVVESNGEELSDYEVGAFCEGECRGSARPIYIEALDRYMIFLTVFGEGEEEISFRLYDVLEEEEHAYTSNESMVFGVNSTIGSVTEPYVLHFGILGVEENMSNIFNVYPNPAGIDSEIYLGTNCDKVEIYNTIGVKIAEYDDVEKIEGIGTAGVYVIKMHEGNNISYSRIVVR